jgi:hypothetical protein
VTTTASSLAAIPRTVVFGSGSVRPTRCQLAPTSSLLNRRSPPVAHSRVGCFESTPRASTLVGELPLGVPKFARRRRSPKSRLLRWRKASRVSRAPRVPLSRFHGGGRQRSTTTRPNHRCDIIRSSRPDRRDRLLRCEQWFEPALRPEEPTPAASCSRLRRQRSQGQSKPAPVARPRRRPTRRRDRPRLLALRWSSPARHFASVRARSPLPEADG